MCSIYGFAPPWWKVTKTCCYNDFVRRVNDLPAFNYYSDPQWQEASITSLSGTNYTNSEVNLSKLKQYTHMNKEDCSE